MGHFYAIFSWKLGLTRRFRCAKFNTFPKSHTFVLVHKCAITFFLCYLYIVLYALLVLYINGCVRVYVYPAKNRTPICHASLPHSLHCLCKALCAVLTASMHHTWTDSHVMPFASLIRQYVSKHILLAVHTMLVVVQPLQGHISHI